MIKALLFLMALTAAPSIHFLNQLFARNKRWINLLVQIENI